MAKPRAGKAKVKILRQVRKLVTVRQVKQKMVDQGLNRGHLKVIATVLEVWA